MMLTDYLSQSPALRQIFTAEASLRALETTLKTGFPPAIAAQFRLVCLDNGKLVIYAANNITANFLNLRKTALQDLITAHHADLEVNTVKVKVRPLNDNELPPVSQYRPAVTAVFLRDLAVKTPDPLLKDLFTTLSYAL